MQESYIYSMYCQQVSTEVTPSIAAAAQSQLAQLLAHHGDGILQVSTVNLLSLLLDLETILEI